MFIRIYRKKSLNNLAVIMAFLGISALLLSKPQAMMTGISRGLSICSDVIIPTLYPFMILAGWLTDSSLCRNPPRWLGKFTRRVFGLPGCCAPVILIGLIGGYPAGALAIGGLRQQGKITTEQARRMTKFCINGGPGFIISTVGAGMLGNIRAGIFLFIAHAATSLGIGIILAHGHRNDEYLSGAHIATHRPLAHMVEDTCKALLCMCGFVVLASTVLSLSDAAGIPVFCQKITGWNASHVRTFTAAVMEVSCGCLSLTPRTELTPFWMSLCLSWGGLSVHGQVAAALNGESILNLGFFATRFIHGTVSGCISLLLFRLLPVGSGAVVTAMAPVGGGNAPVCVSPAASCMLLLLTFLAMLCFSPKNTGKSV